MFRFSFLFASKLRLLNKGIQPVGGRFSFGRRNYIKYSPFNNYKIMMAEAMLNEGRKALASGVNPTDLIEGIEMAVGVVSEYLKSRARMISTFEVIAQVAKASANGDGEIGELIAKAMDKVGKKQDHIIISEEKSLDTKLEFVNKMKLSWTPISRYLLHDEGETNVLKNPFVLIHEEKISDKNVIIQAIGPTGHYRSLLVVSDGVELAVAGSKILDSTCYATKLCFVKPSEFEENSKAIMQDLAVVTGARVVTGASTLSFIPLMLGSCKEVVVSRNEMTVVGGSGHQVDIEQRCEQLRSEIKLSKSDDEVKLLEERLVKLSSQVAYLKVGGANKEEVREKNAIVTNALNAAKAAVEEGIVPGGDIALLHASKELDKLQTTSFGGKTGVQILQHALKIPFYTIASIAGFQLLKRY